MKTIIISIFIIILSCSGIVWAEEYEFSLRHNVLMYRPSDCQNCLWDDSIPASLFDAFTLKLPDNAIVKCQDVFETEKPQMNKDEDKIIDVLKRTREFINDYSESPFQFYFVPFDSIYPFQTEEQIKKENIKKQIEELKEKMEKINREIQLREEIDNLIKGLGGK